MKSFRTGAATQANLPPIVPVDDLPEEVMDIVDGIQLVHYQLIGPEFSFAKTSYSNYDSYINDAMILNPHGVIFFPIPTGPYEWIQVPVIPQQDPRALFNGGGGDDFLWGGDNWDELRGDSGDDAIFGNGGNDLILGELGNDFLYGGDGDDLVIGHSYLRTAYHPISPELDPGNDLLDGGEGNDRLFAGKGADIMTGGGGIDQFQIEPGESLVIGHDTITDFNADEDVFLLALTYYPLYEFDRFFNPTDVTTQAFAANTVAEVAAGAVFSGNTGTLILGELQSEVAVVNVDSGDLAGTSWLAIDWYDNGDADDIVEITGYTGEITTDSFLDDAVEYSQYIGDWWEFYL